jgi:hypothetical protein
MTPGAALAKFGELDIAAPSHVHTRRNDDGVLFVPYRQVDAAAAAACDARLAADSAWHEIALPADCGELQIVVNRLAQQWGALLPLSPREWRWRRPCVRRAAADRQAQIAS